MYFTPIEKWVHLHPLTSEEPQRPCHLLQSCLNSCHHPRVMLDIGYIYGYPRKWYSLRSPSTDADFFSANLSIIHPAVGIRTNIAWIMVLRPKPWGLQFTCPHLLCLSSALVLCRAPRSSSCNGFWMLPVRQEQYSTTDLTPGVWIEYTKSSQILIYWKWVSSSEWWRALLLYTKQRTDSFLLLWVRDT